MADVELSYEWIGEAMRSDGVRQELARKARKVQGRAEQLASGDNVKLDSRVSEGTRPKGRPYARVESPNVQQEWGGSKTARRRVLGRAAESS